MRTSDRFINKLNETAKAIANKEEVGELETAMLALRTRNKRGFQRKPSYFNSSQPGPSRQVHTSPKYVQQSPQRYNRRATNPVGTYDAPALPGPSTQKQYSPGQRYGQGSNQAQGYNMQNIICHYCKEPRHFKSAYAKLKNKLDQSTKDQTYDINHQAKMALATGESPRKPNPQFTDSTWNIDSCCSAHMTSHLEWIQGYQPFDTQISVRLADKHIVPALGSGTILTSFGSLHNVLYVPDMKANLLSMSSAAKSNIEFRTNSTGMWIYYGSRFKLKALQDNNVYSLNLEVIPPEQKASAAVTLDHWHQRLAHMPEDLILKVVRNNLVVPGG